MEEFLQQVFHRVSFLPHQKEVISKIIEGRDCIALLPTAAGKSLCYQYPAMYLRKCFVVISPLKALMTNQIADLLAKFGIIAFQFSSAIATEEKMKVLTELEKKESVGQLLYTTPESLQNPLLINVLNVMHRNERLGGFVFDEAHTIIDYGGFRPEYAKINLRVNFPKIPISLFSATLTPDAIRLIKTQLQLNNAHFETAPLNRPNITPIFNYCEAKKRDGELVDFIRQRTSKTCGIIYCNTGSICTSMVKKLNDVFGENFSREYYRNMGESNKKIATPQNGKESEAIKNKVLEEWMEGKICCVVATSAFGMGINKDNIRYVVNYDPPKSPTELVQYMGRAGRDGEQAYYLVFCNHSLTFALFSIFPAKECSDGIWKVKQIFAKEQGAICARPRMLWEFSKENVKCDGKFEKCTFCRMTEEERAKLTKEAETAKRAKEAKRKRPRNEK